MAGAMFGETSDAGYEGQHEWVWVTNGPTAMTRNKDGITGWGRIQRSTNAAVVAGQVLRIHVCFNNPCNRRHPGSKRGLYGPGVHMREVQDPFAPEVALPEMEAAPAVAAPEMEPAPEVKAP